MRTGCWRKGGGHSCWAVVWPGYCGTALHNTGGGLQVQVLTVTLEWQVFYRAQLRLGVSQVAGHGHSLRNGLALELCNSDDSH